MLSTKRSTVRAFAIPYRVLSRKKLPVCDRRSCVVLEFVSLRGEKKIKPHPQNRILVSLRGSFQNFRQAPLSFFIWGTPHPQPPPFFLILHRTYCDIWWNSASGKVWDECENFDSYQGRYYVYWRIKILKYTKLSSADYTLGPSFVIIVFLITRLVAS